MIHLRNVKENKSFAQIFTDDMKDSPNICELFESDLGFKKENSVEDFLVRTDVESWFSNTGSQKGTCHVEI